jgi:hypothetical protein
MISERKLQFATECAFALQLTAMQLMEHARADIVPDWAREYLRDSLAGAMRRSNLGISLIASIALIILLVSWALS